MTYLVANETRFQILDELPPFWGENLTEKEQESVTSETDSAKVLAILEKYDLLTDKIIELLEVE